MFYYCNYSTEFVHRGQYSFALSLTSVYAHTVLILQTANTPPLYKWISNDTISNSRQYGIKWVDDNKLEKMQKEVVMA
jgi:hypothetical protein